MSRPLSAPSIRGSYELRPPCLHLRGIEREVLTASEEVQERVRRSTSACYQEARTGGFWGGQVLCDPPDASPGNREPDGSEAGPCESVAPGRTGGESNRVVATAKTAGTPGGSRSAGAAVSQDW
ncbi:hypothetical protein [Methanoculleus chikugoensis]|uniref:hypothetical protein n=1 Tax=Methanoculleus chikugoensis TaxID=118126 RepID=UPI001FB52A2B|nr:hypothetical protein [Methanoculleus chikugoensis]